MFVTIILKNEKKFFMNNFFCFLRPYIFGYKDSNSKDQKDFYNNYKNVTQWYRKKLDLIIILTLKDLIFHIYLMKLNISELCKLSKTTDLACLASCNSKSECLTVIYDRIQVITNCFMYNRYIKSSDLINSNNFILYEKKFGNYCIKNHKFKFKLTGYYSLLNAF